MKSNNILETKMKTNTNAENEFYSKDFWFSYSSLNKLLYSPRSFYNWYILNEKEESLDSHLVGGKIVHCLLLEPENFSKEFAIMPGKLPGASNKKIVDIIYKEYAESSDTISNDLTIYSDAIINELTYMQLHQKLVDDKDLKKEGSKTGDQKRLSKVLTAENIEYFKFLVNSSGKIIIDQETYDKSNRSVEAVKSNSHISKLMGLDVKKNDFELLQVCEKNVEVWNELFIQTKIQNGVGFKGFIDNLVLDHANQKIIINDLKTTSKSLTDFPETVKYYKYWMQAAIYYRLTEFWNSNNIGVDIKNYKIEFNFIVIDKMNQAYGFPVKKESMEQWLVDLDVVITQAMWHYNEHNYDLPYKFALKQVTL
jgi:hypothetical protein